MTIHPQALLLLSLIAFWVVGVLAAYKIGGQPCLLVDTRRLAALTVCVTLCGCLFALLLLKTVFADSSLGFEALCSFYAWGVVDLALCSSGALYMINTHYDASAPEKHLQSILRKYITTGRHGSVHYHISIQHWRDSAQTYSLPVAQSVYDSVHEGSKITLLTHPGYLNCEWIEQYEIVNP